ncbi:hypothetical protein MBAV_001751 [Candidatus Magnetobacterium bavaricum]|uniref:Uncharacterized protein n=1 Tax=Candidatus Magnetobacterium bavaricum TaxID=29290 RepID=A0A0F3GW18_9BACT|nr:hypothetical protein MBAV_001751 [Candidatus Magnetobacterium bavaricum]
MTGAEAIIRPLADKIDSMVESVLDSLEQMASAVNREYHGKGSGGWYYIKALEQIREIKRLVGNYIADNYKIEIEKMGSRGENVTDVEEIMRPVANKIVIMLNAVLESLRKMSDVINREHHGEGTGGWHYVKALAHIREIEQLARTYTGDR